MGGSLGKRGLTDRLREVGCMGSAGLFWADKMRVGLVGEDGEFGHLAASR